MLLLNLDLLATAPGGVARLRELILTLAVQGKLVPQDPADEPASGLLRKIRAEKDRLIAEGKIKRDKPLAPIADGEKPFELPEGWDWVRLAEVAFPQAGFAFKSNGFNEAAQGLPLIRIRDVGESDPRTFFLGDYREEFVVEFGEWLISMDGEFRVRKWLGPKALLNQRVTRLMFFGEEVFRPFVTASLQFKLSEIQGTKAYTTVDHLSGGQIAASVIALPPLAEQSRIVTRVEELMRLCDALEAKGRLEAAQHAQLVSTLLATLTDSATPEALAEHWQRLATHFDTLLDRPEAVDALEQTILQLAVRGLLVPQNPADEPARELLKKVRQEKDRLIAAGQIKRDKPLPPITDDEKPFEVPAGWEWVRVSDVVDMLNGYAFKSEWFKNAGVRLVRNVNVSHGYVDWSQPAVIDANAATEFQQFALQAGDIVLSLDRPIISTGLKYAVIRESDLPCLLLQRVARLAPEVKLIASEFLVLWLQSDLFVGTIDPGRSNGVPHISTKQVGGLAFALPPLAEQSRIVARIEALRRLCADLRQRLAASQTAQARLAEALVENVF